MAGGTRKCRTMRPERLLPLLLGLLLPACMVPPPVEMRQPEPPVAADYAPATTATGATTAATSVGFADFFPDSRLHALIERGLARNRDLAVAVAQIAAARAQYRIQQSSRFPELDSSGTRTRTRTPTSAITATPFISNQQSIGVSVPGFELDFWGRISNMTAAARSRYLATAAGEQGARLALIRSIAEEHWLVLEADERLALAEATVDSRREAVRIARQRLDAGVTSALDFRQAESLLTQAETDLASLRLAHAQGNNLLTVLVGGPVPESLPPPLPLEKQEPETVLAAGLPSDLLRVRPDILAAEENLRAARADIGAARAAFFPRISLTGSLGYASTELGDLFTSDKLTWSFGPSISLPIFDWGQRRGNLDLAVARQDIAVSSYEKTVQEAFREVADALAGRQYYAEEVEAQQRSAMAFAAIAQLAQTRYREGVASYLEVLDAERNLFTAQQALLTLRRQELANLAGLYAALGGGLSTP